jgi:predicted GIY-YIG superfamily endonuclease
MYLTYGNIAHALEREELIKKVKQTRYRKVIQENGKANKNSCQTFQSKEE